MSKSNLTIYKEVLKKEYAKSPLGLAEKKLREFYDESYLKSNPIPEEILEKIDKIRGDNEKKYLEYIETRQKTDKEWLDDRLLEAMTEEISLLEANSTTNMNDQ